MASMAGDATAAGVAGVDVSAAVGGGAAVVDSSGASRTTFSFQSGSSSDSTCSSYQAWSVPQDPAVGLIYIANKLFKIKKILFVLEFYEIHA